MDTPNATPQDLTAPKSLIWPAGWTVRYVAETGSTNSDLLTASLSDGSRGLFWPHLSVLVAGHQSAGKGRLERTWEAPPNSNLLASVLIRELPEHVHVLTQRIGLAIVLAVREHVDLNPNQQVTLKWPNDVLLEGRKLAGVLAQTKLDHNNQPVAVVVGFGVNIKWCPDGATSLRGLIHPHELLLYVLEEYNSLAAMSESDFSAEYRSNLSTLGARVRVELPDSSSVVGTAVDVAIDGELKLVDQCGISHFISAGDVIHLRPHDGDTNG